MIIVQTKFYFFLLLQCILGYTIHQTANDTTTLQSHMESLKENPGKMPDTLVADAGYGSEENYEYLANNDDTFTCPMGQ